MFGHKRLKGFADLANFWFGFSVLSSMKLRVFGFGVLRGLRVFSDLVFGFRFWSTVIAVFRIFLASAFLVFLVLPRKLHLEVALKL